MTEYIVNPMMFYWMQVSDELRGLLFIFGILLGIALITSTIITIVNCEYNDDEQNRRSKKLIKTFAISTVICVMVGVFVPAKETLIEMSIAKMATVENAQIAIETIKEAADYVFEKIDGLNDDK